MTVYEVVLTGTQDAEPHLNVLHYDVTGSTDFQLLADAFRTEITNGLSALIVPSLRWQGITIREDVQGAVGVYYPFTSGDLIGENAEGNYAANVAALVRKYADATTRPNQGRAYQGGIPISALTGEGNLGGAFVSSLSAAWDNLRVVEFNGTGEAVMQIKASNLAAPNTVPYNTVARLSVAFRLSTQKRRNFGT